MTKQFIEKIKREWSVDTKNYRYIYKVFADHAEIRRIRLEYLDTTAALTEWETVYESR